MPTCIADLRSNRTQAHQKCHPESLRFMPPSPGTPQTIMVVDDNSAVLLTVVKILEAADFRVLSAGDAQAALKIAEGTADHIDLLLSDVDMPLMSGPELGEAMKKARPKMHVMLMSGGHNGNLLVLNYGWAYIQKPFVPRS